MRPVSPSSLRVRFLVLIIIAMSPALGLVLYTSHEQRLHKIADAEQNATALAQLVSADEERLIEEARALLMGLAMSWELENGSPNDCQPLLTRVLTNNPHYRNFGFVDENGILQCSALPFREGLDLSDRQYVRRAIELRGFGVGGYQVGRVTGEQSINFGYPVFGPTGRVEGVVYGALSLSALARVAGDVSKVLPEEAVLTKMDGDGTVLARTPGGKDWVGREAPEFALIRDRLPVGSGCLRTTGASGEPELISFAPVRSRMSGGEVYVVLSTPERVAFAGVSESSDRNLILLGLSAMLALLIAWVLGRIAFAKPMDRLVEATEVLQGGDLTVRIGEPYPSHELGELARAFDATVQDLQQRQQERDDAEAALRRSEQDYRSMWKHAPYGIIRTTREGRILMANPAAVEMLGFESEYELVETRRAQDLYADPEDRENIFVEHEGDETARKIQVRWLRKNGEELLISFNGRRLRDDADAEYGYELFLENETQRRRLEDQLRQAQKMEAVGRLAGGVAHDFNNLLGIMLGYSNMMMSELRPDDPNYERAHEIRQATEKAAALTQQLLFISRRQVVEPQVLDLNRVVEGMESMLRSLVGERIRMEVQTEPLPPVRADAGQMEQVLLNLVVNARDAMPDGGRVTVATEDVDLAAPIVDDEVQIDQGHYVRLTVTDTGIGIDRDTRTRVFEPFFTTKPKEKGSGLGLSTVQGIVERSGGKIRLLSKLGQGARFEIYLPITTDEPKPARPGTPPRVGRTGPETILLVEDEESLRTMTRRFLESEGYKVLEARSGSNAIEQAQRHQGTIHLLITDVIMPQLSGREVAERIRKLRPDINVLFVSGYADDVIVDHGMLMENAAFLAKPFAPDVLLRKVQEVMRDGE